jgi:hypothetical protein
VIGLRAQRVRLGCVFPALHSPLGFQRAHAPVGTPFTELDVSHALLTGDRKMLLVPRNGMDACIGKVLGLAQNVAPAGKAEKNVSTPTSKTATKKCSDSAMGTSGSFSPWLISVREHWPRVLARGGQQSRFAG